MRVMITKIIMIIRFFLNIELIFSHCGIHTFKRIGGGGDILICRPICHHINDIIFTRVNKWVCQLSAVAAMDGMLFH